MGGIGKSSHPLCHSNLVWDNDLEVGGIEPPSESNAKPPNYVRSRSTILAPTAADRQATAEASL